MSSMKATDCCRSDPADGIWLRFLKIQVVLVGGAARFISSISKDKSLWLLLRGRRLWGGGGSVQEK